MKQNPVTVVIKTTCDVYGNKLSVHAHINSDLKNLCLEIYVCMIKNDLESF